MNITTLPIIVQWIHTLQHLDSLQLHSLSLFYNPPQPITKDWFVMLELACSMTPRPRVAPLHFIPSAFRHPTPSIHPSMYRPTLLTILPLSLERDQPPGSPTTSWSRERRACAPSLPKRFARWGGTHFRAASFQNFILNKRVSHTTPFFCPRLRKLRIQ